GCLAVSRCPAGVRWLSTTTWPPDGGMPAFVRLRVNGDGSQRLLVFPLADRCGIPCCFYRRHLVERQKVCRRRVEWIAMRCEPQAGERAADDAGGAAQPMGSCRQRHQRLPAAFAEKRQHARPGVIAPPQIDVVAIVEDR